MRASYSHPCQSNHESCPQMIWQRLHPPESLQTHTHTHTPQLVSIPRPAITHTLERFVTQLPTSCNSFLCLLETDSTAQMCKVCLRALGQRDAMWSYTFIWLDMLARTVLSNRRNTNYLNLNLEWNYNTNLRIYSITPFKHLKSVWFFLRNKYFYIQYFFIQKGCIKYTKSNRKDLHRVT